MLLCLVSCGFDISSLIDAIGDVDASAQNNKIKRNLMLVRKTANTMATKLDQVTWILVFLWIVLYAHRINANKEIVCFWFHPFVVVTRYNCFHVNEKVSHFHWNENEYCCVVQIAEKIVISGNIVDYPNYLSCWGVCVVQNEKNTFWAQNKYEIYRFRFAIFSAKWNTYLRFLWCVFPHSTTISQDVCRNATNTNVFVVQPENISSNEQ